MTTQLSEGFQNALTVWHALRRMSDRDLETLLAVLDPSQDWDMDESDDLTSFLMTLHSFCHHEWSERLREIAQLESLYFRR
jgi:hypothetical protein